MAMKHIRPEVYQAIRDNDLKSVVFADPLSAVARQAKRNLLIASFVALLIAVLQLRVTGFLGLQASEETLGNLLAQGLACLVVAYFAASFVFHVFVDYSAWNFERERALTQPYLDLIRLVEQQVSVTSEHLDDACSSVRGVVIEGDMPSQVEAKKNIANALHKLSSIDQRLAALDDEIRPLTDSWADTIQSMSHLDARFRMRVLSLWCLDIIFPLVMALLALWSTMDGVVEVIEKVIA
jgi:hypothetical protein